VSARGDFALWPAPTALIDEHMSRTSVVIPTYNRAAYLSEAIESALAQSRPPLEVIVVDDGSTDQTAETVRRFGDRIRYLRQANAGVAAARNTGIAAARGELVALLDSDDAWDACHLEATEAVLRASPDVALVFTNYAEWRGTERKQGTLEEKELFTVFRRWGLSLRDTLSETAITDTPEGALPYRQGWAAPLLFFGNFILCSTVTARRSALQMGGGFRAGWSYCEDWELFLRIARDHRLAYVDRSTVSYRQHGSQTVGQLDGLRVRDLILSVLEANLDLVPRFPGRLRALAARRVARAYADRSLARLRNGDPSAGRRDLLASLSRSPIDHRAWLLLPFTFLPSSVTLAAAHLHRRARSVALR